MNQTLNILHVTDTLTPGGAERVAVDIANELALRDFNIFFIATRSGGKLQTSLSSRIKYVCLNRNSRFDLKGILQFRNFIRKNNIDYVHAHGNSSAMFCIVSLIGFFRVKIIHHDHNSLFFKRNEKYEKIILRRAYKWLAVSKTIYERALRIGHKDVQLLYNPINLSRFEITNNLQKNEIRIVIIANYREEKDYDTLIDAIHLLFKQGSLKEYKIKVNCFGSYEDSFYGKNIIKKIEKLSIKEYILINPSTSDVPLVLKNSDFAILCSKSEGLPISLLEYMAAKLPIIVTNVGEMGRLVNEANCGLIINSSDHIQLADAIIKMIRNIDKWDDWGNNAHAYVSKYHSVESIVEQLLNNVYK